MLRVTFAYIAVLIGVGLVVRGVFDWGIGFLGFAAVMVAFGWVKNRRLWLKMKVLLTGFPRP
jgi:hypothetical protein